MKAEILEALDDLVRERGISREVLIEAIEAALISAYRRNFGAAQNVRVFFDDKTGEYRVYAQKEIVEEVTDPRLQVSLEEARMKNPNLQLGDVFEVEVTPRGLRPHRRADRQTGGGAAHPRGRARDDLRGVLQP